MRSQGGFSLMEMIITMAVMSLFLAIAMPNYNKIHTKAKVLKARAEVYHISNAVNMYYMDHGTYPSNLSQLTSGGVNAYMKVIPNDPWGHQYVYNASDNTVSSLGADGTAGGTGNNADIVSSNNL